MESQASNAGSGKDFTSPKYQQKTRLLLAIGVGLGFLFAFIAAFGATISAAILQNDDVVPLVLALSGVLAIAAAVVYSIVHARQEKTKRAVQNAYLDSLPKVDRNVRPFG